MAFDVRLVCRTQPNHTATETPRTTTIADRQEGLRHETLAAPALKAGEEFLQTFALHLVELQPVAEHLLVRLLAPPFLVWVGRDGACPEWRNALLLLCLGKALFALLEELW